MWANLNHLQVENATLIHDLTDEEDEEMGEPEIKKEPPSLASPNYNAPAHASAVNSQVLDLQAYPSVYNEEEVETDEDLDKLWVWLADP